MDKLFDIVVDAQNDFMRPDGKLYVPDAEMIIPALNQYIAELTDSVGVLFTFDTHFEDTYPKSEEAKQFPIHCIKNTPGWRLAVDLGMSALPIHTLEKGVFDMWAEPHLKVITVVWTDESVEAHPNGIDREMFFENLKQAGVSKVRITGVAADYCVKWAIDGLLERGFDVEVVNGLTVGIERQIEQVIQEEFPDFADRAVIVR